MLRLSGMCWFFLDSMIFCNNFARWLQRIVAICDALVFWDVLVFLDSMIFCNNFARWLQEIVATCASWHLGGAPPPLPTHPAAGLPAAAPRPSSMRWLQSTESPILFRSCGHETPFYDQKGASKIGDIVLWCDVLWHAMCWFFWDATILCNNFARWLQKIVACEAMCWFSGMGATSSSFWCILACATLASVWCNLVIVQMQLNNVSDHVTWFERLLSCIWTSCRQLAPFWNESPTDLDNVIIIWWNLVILRDNSPRFQTTLRGPSDCRVVSNKNEISSK